MQTPKPDYKHVTIEDIRKLKGYDKISDAKAERLLRIIQQYASLLASFHENQQ